MLAKFFLLHRRLWLLLLSSFALFSCQGYQVSVNEMRVYEPKGLLTQIDANDPALRNCLLQWISDQAISSPEQLLAVSCSHAGVQVLSGIDQFQAMIQLDLADNQIESLSGLAGLAKLNRLDLANNQLQDLQILFNLPRLEWVNLLGNDQVNCKDINQLADQNGVQVQLPSHCT